MGYGPLFPRPPNRIMEKRNNELRRLLEAVERKFTKHPFKALATGKLTRYLRGLEKPKRETLDKISLFVGFQNWEDFQAALHGVDDGQTNYGEDALPEVKTEKGDGRTADVP